MIITYETEDKSLKYEIQVKQGHPLKFNSYGKCWAKRTEVTILQNGFSIGSNFVTKHHKDENNFKYAVVNAARPIINLIKIKWIRKELWKRLLLKINKYDNK